MKIKRREQKLCKVFAEEVDQELSSRCWLPSTWRAQFLILGLAMQRRGSANLP